MNEDWSSKMIRYGKDVKQNQRKQTKGELKKVYEYTNHSPAIATIYELFELKLL